MLKNFTVDEKMALIGALKKMIHADGILDENEINFIRSFAIEEGFEDFNEIFNRYDKEIETEEDFIQLLEKIKNEDVQVAIVENALKVMIMDGIPHEEENKVADQICDIWNIDKQKVLDYLLEDDDDEY